MTRDGMALQNAGLKYELRMAEQREAIAKRERDEAVALNQAVSRLLRQYQSDYHYCERHGHEQKEPCPDCVQEARELQWAWDSWTPEDRDHEVSAATNAQPKKGTKP